MCALNEIIVERRLVEEDPRISELFVEPILSLLHALDDTIYVTVTRKDNECRIRAACEWIWHSLWMEVFGAGSGFVGGIGGFAKVQLLGNVGERRDSSIVLMRETEDEMQAKLLLVNVSLAK